MLSSTIRRQAPDVKYPEKVEQESQPDRIPDMRYPEKMERRKGDRLRVHGVGTHPEQLHLDSPRGHRACIAIQTPSGRSTRHSRSSHPDDSISYPDMLSGWKRQLAIAHAALRWCVQTPCALPWIPKNSPQSWIALVIKKLSKHQNLTQFD